MIPLSVCVISSGWGVIFPLTTRFMWIWSSGKGRGEGSHRASNWSRMKVGCRMNARPCETRVCVWVFVWRCMAAETTVSTKAADETMPTVCESVLHQQLTSTFQVCQTQHRMLLSVRPHMKPFRTFLTCITPDTVYFLFLYRYTQ